VKVTGNVRLKKGTVEFDSSTPEAETDYYGLLANLRIDTIVNEAKDAIKISEETQLSLSNVYKTLANLEKLTLIIIEKFGVIEKINLILMDYHL